MVGGGGGGGVRKYFIASPMDLDPSRRHCIGPEVLDLRVQLLLQGDLYQYF